jgi:hypothetical protein
MERIGNKIKNFYLYCNVFRVLRMKETGLLGKSESG